MTRPASQLRRDALAIWQAGVDAVKADRLVREAVRIDGQWLLVGEVRVFLPDVGRIAVVGAGKAGGGMAEGLLQSLGEQVLRDKHVSGWINVPENCVRQLPGIELHGARPAGVNEPTVAGVEGSREILRRVSQLAPQDLCIALISGGGSALLPLPCEGITLDDKLAVTRYLSAEGAPIEALNTVRKQLSLIKGGGLARACRAGRLVALVISDILGDPLDLIASGPTVRFDTSPLAALDILDRYGARAAGIAPRAFQVLTDRVNAPSARSTLVACEVTNLVIGNNAVAVAAAAREARRLGYHPIQQVAAASEGPAEEVGQTLAEQALRLRDGTGPDCLISGGEPTVKLVAAKDRGLGGRNQQLVLAGVETLAASPAGILLLSGGTDGEDGPTDAAGAWTDAAMIEEAKQRGLSPRAYLERNDAYHWFEPLGGLLLTGPTDTNVCDVRVVLVERTSPTTSDRPADP